MIKHTYREKWAKHVQGGLNDFKEILMWDLFENWERNRMPGSTAEDELREALPLLYAHHPGPEAKQYLDRCILIVERALAEKKCESKRCRDSFPLDRGELMRAYCYAKALVGKSLDLQALLQASADIEEWCAEIDRSNWDEIAQQVYLSAVRLALIAEDLPRAKRLMVTRRSFRYHQKEFLLWKTFIPAVKVAPIPLPAGKLLNQFDAYFDRMRKPTLAEEVLALELGILREKYFVSTDGKIHWDRVIEMVSQ